MLDNMSEVFYTQYMYSVTVHVLCAGVFIIIEWVSFVFTYFC
jgi:hypothetical protein